MNFKTSDLCKLVCKVASSESERSIRRLERELDISFPDSLVQVYLFTDEGHMGPIKCYSDSELHFDLHAVKKTHYKYVGSTVLYSYRSFIEFNPRWQRVIPIGGRGNGDEICLDFRIHNEPVVVNWNHEINYQTDEPFSLLARSFDELLDRASPSRFDYYKSVDEAITREKILTLLGEYNMRSLDEGS